MKHRKFAAALLCASMLYGLPAPAKADPISAAILTFAGIEATAAAVAVTTFGLGLAASAALSTVVALIKGSPATAATSSTTTVGTQFNSTYGATVPRSRIHGRQLTGGQYGYWNLSGADNKALDQNYHLGDGPHHSLAGMIANGKTCTFGATDANGIIVTDFNSPDDGSPRMWVQFHQGFEDQAADARLVATANPVGRWTADDKLSGVCYVRVTTIYDEKVFPGGSLPALQFDVKGALLYDPRKDSTNGGFGAHRWTDQHTWEWSDNVAVGLYNHQRGLYLNGELIIGEGLAPFDLITAMYIAAANACDELVALKGGGTEKRYRIAMNVGADQQHDAVIKNFLDAMAGQLLEQVGSFGPIAGVAQTVALPTLTDADLIVGKPVTFSAKRSRVELINAVFGSYTEPAQQYAMIPYPPRTSAADEATDGERLAPSGPVDYPQVQSGTQAQRLGEITRRLSRAQATATIIVRYRWLIAEPGDWLAWNSSNPARGNRLWRVDSTVKNDDKTVTLQLREINAAAFAFNPDVDQLDPNVPGDLPGIGALLTTLAGFTPTAEQVYGADGLVVPALRCLWSPTSDRTIVTALVQYRVKTVGDTGLIKQQAFDRPDSGEGMIFEGIQANTVYQARATIVTIPARFTTFTPWIDQVAPALHVVPVSNRTLSAEFAALDAGIKYQITTLQNAFASRLAAIEDAFSEATAEVAARSQNNVNIGNQQAYDHRIELIDRIALGDDALGASITSVRTIATGTEAAFASYQTVVNAHLIATDANVSTNATAVATLNTSFATYQTAVAAHFTATDATVSTNATGLATLNTAFSTYTTVTAVAAFGSMATVTANSSAISTLNGYAAAQYAVDLNVNGFATGFKLVNGGGGISSFVVVANKFQIQLPGYNGSAPVSVFTTGTVNGVASIGITGNIALDGTFFGTALVANTVNVDRMIAGTITSASGKIGALSLTSLSIGDNAVTVPVAQSLGFFLGTGAASLIFNVTLSIDTTGLSGKTIAVYAICNATLNFTATNVSWATNMFINGNSVMTSNGLNGTDFLISGAGTFTATGGVQSIPVQVYWNCPNSGNIVNASFFSIGAKR